MSETPSRTPGDEQKDDFDAVYDRLTTNLGIDKLGGVEGSEQSQEPDVDQLQSELAQLNVQYGAMMDKGSPEARRLRGDIANIHDAISAAMRQKADLVKPEEPSEPAKKSTIEYVDQLIYDCQAEYDALSDEDKAGVKGKELQSSIASHGKVKQLVQDIINGKDPTPAPAPTPTEKKSKKEEDKKVKEREKQFGDIRKATIEKYSEEYDAKKRELADINAKLMTSIFHRRRNTLRAQQLEQELAQINKKIQKDFLKTAKSEGRYQLDIDDPKKAAKAKWRSKVDDLVDLGVAYDEELDSQITVSLVERQKNLNGFQRFLAKVGNKWINKGNVRNALGGLGSGFAGSALLTGFGATMPVSAAVLGTAGAVGSVFTYAGSREAGIADMVQKRKTTSYERDDNAIQQVKDAIGKQTDQMIAYKVKGKKSHVVDAVGNAYLSSMQNERKRNTKEYWRGAGKAAIKAATFATTFVGGAKAGSIATGAVKGMFAPKLPTMPTGDMIDTDTVREMERKTREAGYHAGYQDALNAAADQAPGGDFEFASGADVITEGEGWYSQFGDMGATPEQVRELFKDRDLMNDLVKAGAAYIDNSARIGGFGINMPASGHLSADAINMIKEAMIAKGMIS